MKLKKAILLYDGECEFCLRWVKRWEKWTGGAFDYAPCQEYVGVVEGLTEGMCLEAVRLLEVDGRLYSAAEAVLRTLRGVRGCGFLYSLYKNSRVFAWVSEFLYKCVARSRGWLSKIM